MKYGRLIIKLALDDFTLTIYELLLLSQSVFVLEFEQAHNLPPIRFPVNTKIDKRVWLIGKRTKHVGLTGKKTQDADQTLPLYLKIFIKPLSNIKGNKL